MEFTPGLFALGGLVLLAACLLKLLLQSVNELVALGKLQLRTATFGSQGRELGLLLLEDELEFTPGLFALGGLVLLAACLLKLLLQSVNELVALGKLQLRTATFGSQGRELGLLLLEDELEFTPGLFALGGLVLLAACLLKLLLQSVNELVALGKLQLRTATFGPMLLKRSLEFLCVRFAGRCEFDTECLEVGSCGRELRPVLVSGGELDPDAFELLCTLVECRAEAGDGRVLLSGVVRDP